MAAFDWRGMYAQLRAERPILPTPVFTLVTRAPDVLDMLAETSLYRVKPGRLPMDHAVGPIMLARDQTRPFSEDGELDSPEMEWEISTRATSRHLRF